MLENLFYFLLLLEKLVVDLLKQLTNEFGKFKNTFLIARKILRVSLLSFVVMNRLFPRPFYN